MLPPARDPVDPAAVVRAARAGDEIAPVLADLRGRLRERYGASDVLLTRSGTDALALALGIARRIRGSRRASFPAYGCYALATAAVGADARADFYDLDPATLAADPESLRRTLDGGAGAVVLAHLYGYPSASESVLASARESGALVIEDAAQAAGGSLGERPLGTLGDLTVLSFGRGKGVTCGGGGALLVRGPRIPDHMLAEVRGELGGRPAERRAGWTELAVAAAQWAFGRPSLYRIPAALPFLSLGETRYRHPSAPEPIAAGAARLLREALREKPGAAADSRRRTGRELVARLERIGGVRPVRPLPRGEPGALRLPFRLAEGGGGAPALGVVPGYPRLLPDLGVVERPTDAAGAATPGAAALRDSLYTAPTHGAVEARDLDAIARWAAGRAGSGRCAARPGGAARDDIPGTADRPGLEVGEGRT